MARAWPDVTRGEQQRQRAEFACDNLAKSTPKAPKTYISSRICEFLLGVKDIPIPSPISGLVASGPNIRRSGKRFVYLVGHVTPQRVP